MKKFVLFCLLVTVTFGYADDSKISPELRGYNSSQAGTGDRAVCTRNAARSAERPELRWAARLGRLPRTATF